MTVARDARLEVRDLTKHFHVGGGLFGRRRQHIRAVNGVSFDVPPGGCVGLVGESGCGKSTVARSVLRLIEPDEGDVRFGGADVRSASGAALRRLRQRMQIIFQDPYGSLNPRRTVGQTLMEPLLVHGIGSAAERRRKARDAILEVGLQAEALERYPHEFSGGQRQRIGIARALILDPEIIIADEPVSALDVSVQAQILRLLETLRTRRGLAFLFVSHDLGVVRHFCDTVCVMYLGRIVEAGPTRQVLDDPLHPYTRLLRDSSPIPDPSRRVEMIKSEGELPSPANPPSGCPFHPRCASAMRHCAHDLPRLTSRDDHRHVACHLYG